MTTSIPSGGSPAFAVLAQDEASGSPPCRRSWPPTRRSMRTGSCDLDPAAHLKQLPGTVRPGLPARIAGPCTRTTAAGPLGHGLGLAPTGRERSGPGGVWLSGRRGRPWRWSGWVAPARSGRSCDMAPIPGCAASSSTGSGRWRRIRRRSSPAGRVESHSARRAGGDDRPARLSPRAPRDRRRLIRRAHQRRMEAIVFHPGTSTRRCADPGPGTYGTDGLSPGEREPMLAGLLDLYENDPDAGIHGAAEWTLRRCGQQGKLEDLDASLARLKDRGRPDAGTWMLEKRTFVVVDGLEPSRICHRRQGGERRGLSTIRGLRRQE